MKIGEFSKKCGVSKDTIRYYVTNGLLIPNDTNAQYNFTDREYQDILLILKMKEQHFTLKEIQRYFALIRHSNFIEPETIEDCLSMLNQKKDEINDQMVNLQQSLDYLEQEITRLTTRAQKKPLQTGIPLCALPLLVCPHCGRSLRVESAAIYNNCIVSGTLLCPQDKHCSHGYQAAIEHGIIKTGNLYTLPNDRPDLKRGMYRGLGNEFSTCLQKCYNSIEDKLRKTDLHGKVVLEANINGYFFLYNHLWLLPEDCLCIVVDKYPEMLELYKSLIEQLNLKRNILYIADNCVNYPLKPSCVDLHISYFGENEYLLYHNNCYLADAKKYFKTSTQILGAYLSYDKNSKTRKNLAEKYPECGAHSYYFNYLLNDYTLAGYEMSSVKVGSILNTLRKEYSFECHVDGEALEIYSFDAAPTPLKKE